MRCKVNERICQGIKILLHWYSCPKLCPLRTFTLLSLQFSLDVASTSLVHTCFIVSLFEFFQNMLCRYLWKNIHTIN